MPAQGAAIVVGAGPGVGASTARRFAREGFPIGLIARNADRLAGLAAEIEGDAAHATADARDPDGLRRAIRELTGSLGPPEVMVFSPLPDVGLIKPVLETTPEELSEAIDLNVIGGAAAATEVLPGMRKRGSGSLLFTTGSAVLSPNPDRAMSGVTGAAQAVHIRMLHDALAPEGVHVSHTVIVGTIGPGAKHEPDDVAEHLWQRHALRDDAMTVIR